MNKLNLNRRQFARRAIIARAVDAGFKGIIGANDRLYIAIIVCGQRGTY